MITGLQPVVFFEGKDVGLDLPLIVVDDDFIEYLEEESVEEFLEIDEFAIYWSTWLKECTE